MLLRSVAQGRWRLFAVCTPRGDCELLEFLSDQAGDKVARAKREMVGFLDWVAHQPNGPPRNAEISHLVNREYSLWQFSPGHVIRVLWFYDEGHLLILSHGFVKKTKRTPQQEIDRAIQAAKQYWQAKRAGSIHYIEDK